MILAALFTGGKDSTYALDLARRQGHEIAGLITIESENLDSYMFHTPAIELTKLQAEAMGLPLVTYPTKGEKEKELIDLEKAIVKAKEKFGFAGLLTGALFSEYQKSRIEKIARELNLKVISPLWRKSQEELMWELLDNKFEFVLTGVAGEGMSEEWLGKIITYNDLNRLKELNKKIGFHIAFEGGEAESLVLDCSLFRKNLQLIKVRKEMDSSCSGRLIIEEAKLIDK